MTEKLLDGRTAETLRERGIFLEGVLRGAINPHIIPTEIRKSLEGNYTGIKDLSKKEKRKYLTGRLIGLTSQILSYGELSVAEAAPEVLLFPAVTNSLSLLYESGRWISNKIIGKKFTENIYKH